MMKSVCLLFAALLLAACSTTSRVPEGDQLFVGLTPISFTPQDPAPHAATTREEVEAALATAPNGALFGSSYYRTPFPYRLWIYNAFSGGEGAISRWMTRTFGKEPVLMSQVNPSLRALVAKSVLRSAGYFHADVSFQELTQKNPKKAKIGYTVNMDSLFLVDTLTYHGFPPAMQALIDSTRGEALIHRGTPFAASKLDAERQRLFSLFREKGYYFYQPAYASYLADTFALPCRAALRLQLADSVGSAALHPWHIGQVSMNLRRSAMETLTDSAGRSFLKVFYSGKRPPIRPRVLLRGMRLWPKRLYSTSGHQQSLANLNATGVFSSVDFQFTPRAHSDTLDLAVNCTFDKPWDFYIETNFISRTIGRMGPEMKIGLVRKNAFRGGERIDFNVHGAYEWQSNHGGGKMNSYQYGLDLSVEFPRLIMPFVSEKFRRGKNGNLKRPTRFYATPSTILKFTNDINKRPSYYRMHIVSGEWTYRWQPTSSSRHEFSPLTLKYQYMGSHTQRFDDILSENPYLIATMKDIFIPKMRYTYTYTSPDRRLNPLRWETTIEEAGNLTALYDVVIQGNKWNQEGKTLFKNLYSQFIRIETDLTKTWTLKGGTHLVGHVNAGFIYSYGNTRATPFSEGFYAGGAGSVRAFGVRSIGPGGYVPTGSQKFAYLMQNGDMRFVANLEWRFPLISSLYGALFLDAGNVWNLREQASGDQYDSHNMENTKIRLSKFFDQLATGTGIGLRYDLDFLVLRVDWGFGLHLPYATTKGGYFNIPRFRDMHTLHIAIGYPF